MDAVHFLPMHSAPSALLTTILLAVAAPASTQTPEQRIEWNRPMAPFRIVGNVHYVGTAGISAFLISDPAGHILLDGGLPESAPLIADNIRALGFRLEDVRILLNDHAHYDHAGGLAALKRLTGAQLLASAGDRRELESGEIGFRDSPGFAPVVVDGVIGHGEKVRLGDTELTAHLTPGHTPGCTTWTMRVEHEGKPLDVLFACSLTVAGQDLVGDDGYPTAAADFEKSFARLRALHADVFLSSHGTVFGLEDKRARQIAGAADAFLAPDELEAAVASAEQAFREELRRQQAGGEP